MEGGIAESRCKKSFSCVLLHPAASAWMKIHSIHENQRTEPVLPMRRPMLRPGQKE
jgi:hypothetical protein